MIQQMKDNPESRSTHKCDVKAIQANEIVGEVNRPEIFEIVGELNRPEIFGAP